MKSAPTYYDTPERSTPEEIAEQAEIISKEKLVQDILEGLPEVAVVVDDNRQIIACNGKAVSGFGKSSAKEILGRRVGEAISCIHSDEMGPDSCGTSKFCAECGAAQAMKHTRENRERAEEECRITSDINGVESSFDFKVTTAPLKVGERQFTLFAIRDISGDKRREALERIFFHDVLNTASVVNGISQILEDTDEEDFKELTNTLKESSSQLIEEIQMQRTLRYAEDGKLEVDEEVINSNNILKKIFYLYAKLKLTEGKKLTQTLLPDGVQITTDKNLLVRSFGNLVKNAVEASKAGDEIKIWTEAKPDSIKFNVNNPSVIPNEIQVQIFKRSFTTKGGSGRGIGTYSVKLLVEQYLNGKVYFSSTAGEGTTFTIELPIK